MDIKGLKTALGLTKDQEERFDRMKIQTAVMTLNILRNGGNLHGVNYKETKTRRARNKAARKQRRVNRHA
jgi:hypothetical protein